MVSKNKYNEEEIQIDLKEVFYELKRRWWLILLTAIILGGTAGVYTKQIMMPQYMSQAMLYVLSKETTLTSLADLQIGSQLTKDYTVMVTSRPVLQKVIENLGLEMDYKKLRSKITTGNPTDTRILTISVTDPDPVRAKAITDKVAEEASNYIGDIMEMVPPKMIEDGEIPQYPVSPSTKKNTVVGCAAGLLLSCAVIIVRIILNDTLQTEDDVQHYLGISVLASIPKRNDGKDGTGKYKKNHKQR